MSDIVLLFHSEMTLLATLVPSPAETIVWTLTSATVPAVQIPSMIVYLPNLLVRLF